MSLLPGPAEAHRHDHRSPRDPSHLEMPETAGRSPGLGTGSVASLRTAGVQKGSGPHPVLHNEGEGSGTYSVGNLRETKPTAGGI